MGSVELATAPRGGREENTDRHGAGDGRNVPDQPAVRCTRPLRKPPA
jgi:hypothetical protein